MYCYARRFAMQFYNMSVDGGAFTAPPVAGTDGDNLVAVGVCAMSRKIASPPMQNILKRLKIQDYIQIIVFDEHTIFNKPVEQWPLCNCLIAFYSDGFPLEKAVEYVKLRNPIVFNDLNMQYKLQDRRLVYAILEASGVDVPRHAVLNRQEDVMVATADNDYACEIVETDDVVEVGGEIFHKPFVEKPVSAEDHNIYVYFPSDFGGGAQRLFRKVKNRSSCYSKESSIRKLGSYIYEEFMPTDGTDVKVYAVGPDYAHAEARKSPALDGKVERDESGKEKRYPVILTAKEKLIARQVCLAFKQTVCGFDLLRANGKSYVCDVNGFSFVKNSQKYYEDCAQILLEMITAQVAPQQIPKVPPSVEYLAEEVPVPIPRGDNTLELRCVIGIIRHGDRTPKQKMKMIVKHEKFFELFKELKGFEKGHIKVKKPKQLQKVLDIARHLLENFDENHQSLEVEEKEHKLQQLRTVLEMYGYFSGINRKVQFKLLNKRCEDGAPLLLLILKWGGELTPAGRKQAEELGRAFRCMYPGGAGEYASLPGSGFLRLHSTYRHDLKVYASDEGRVQMTAAAFTKGLLDLEGNVASTLVHLVKRDQHATNMLDTATNAGDALHTVKERLHGLLRADQVFDDESVEKLAPTGKASIVEAIKKVKNPRRACEKLHRLTVQLLEEINEATSSEKNVELYNGETPNLMQKRWGKLVKDFQLSSGRFDISKIPDIYDCIKYDLLHNSKLGLKTTTSLYKIAMCLADVVIPQEYGITSEEKMDIATKILTPLLRKIQADLHHTIVHEKEDFLHRLDARLSKGVVSPHRLVRTRLYFTSESHVHTMLNIFLHGGIEDPNDPQWKESLEKIEKQAELNYMTQIVFMLFEDVVQPKDSASRYKVDVLFSPGVKGRQELLSDELSGPLKKDSPDMPAKTIPWVKRLVLSDTEALLKVQTSSKSPMSRRLSSPANPLRSTSDSTLFRQSRTSAGSNSLQTCSVDSLGIISPPLLDRDSQTPLENLETIRDSTDIEQGKQFNSSKPISIEESDIMAHTEQGNKVQQFSKPVLHVTEESKDSTNKPESGPVNAMRYIASAPTLLSLDGGQEEQGPSTGFGKSPESQQILQEGGLELAAELSSTVEPLNPLCSIPLLKMNDFLQQFSGVALSYDITPAEEEEKGGESPSSSNTSSQYYTALSPVPESPIHTPDSAVMRREC